MTTAPRLPGRKKSTYTPPVDSTQEPPQSPGIYCIKVAGEVIYVGKSVNLYNRYQQYARTVQSARAKGGKRERDIVCAIRRSGSWEFSVLETVSWEELRDNNILLLELEAQKILDLKTYLSCNKTISLDRLSMGIERKVVMANLKRLGIGDGEW
jgi:hypothetical protein